MNKKLVPLLGIVAVVIVAVLFMVKTGSKSSPTSQTSSYDTIFPLPSSVQTFTKTSDEAVNFQTTLSVKDSESFYRTELTKMGLKERTINTAVTETTFSMVFDGYKNGKAVVVQGVDISGKTNINIRFEQI